MSNKCHACDPHHIPSHLDPILDPAMRREYIRNETRRQFFGKAAKGLGVAALASLFGPSLLKAMGEAHLAGTLPSGALQLPHMAPKAKRAISLVMAGGPSQVDTWDYKPAIKYDMDLPLPPEERERLGMAGRYERYPLAPSIFKFKQHGKAGTWVSELLPWTAKIVDEIAVINSMWADSVNHDPAITLLLTGSTVPGRPSVGSWAAYGLGSANENLPTFVNLIAYPIRSGEALGSRLWGSAFLPPKFGAVTLRTAGGDPVLYLEDPRGMDRKKRRVMLDGVQALNRATYEEVGDPETHARIENYEMAFRMQMSVPELTDLRSETAETFDLYGPKSRIPGSFAHSCLLARRMAERGVRFTQIFSQGWDSHSNLPKNDRELNEDIDQPCYGLITDLKQRGLLDETLVFWGGEFGRTPYCQGVLTPDNYGRDHHPRVFTMWAAGGGIKPGIVYGESDEFSFDVARDPVHVRDLHATVLHLLGFDHERLTYRYQGLDQKLTGTTPAHVVEGLLA